MTAAEPSILIADDERLTAEGTINELVLTDGDGERRLITCWPCNFAEEPLHAPLGLPYGRFSRVQETVLVCNALPGNARRFVTQPLLGIREEAVITFDDDDAPALI